MSVSRRYHLTLRADHARTLGEVLFARPDSESAAYVLCGLALDGENRGRLLSRDVVPVDDSHYARRTMDGLTIASESYVPVVKRARREGLTLLLAHSHPRGPARFSPQDDREEAVFFAAVHGRAPGFPHGSLVLTSPDAVTGRIWNSDSTTTPIGKVTTVGDRIKVLSAATGKVPGFFDRQVRAFGPDIQKTLGALTVGVVGVGGTGSATFEQLLRLGVGRILVVDNDRFDATNVNRVYGSRLIDESQPKVAIAARTASETALPTVVEAIDGSVLDEDVARQLRFCDIVFGCTDRELPRLVLGRLATRYLIPVIDTGVLLDSSDQILRTVVGRVTLLRPGAACLLCRGRITPEGLRVEGLAPEERNRLVAQGYVPALATPAPAIVPFTSAVASLAVSEFLQFVTGFMGGRQTTETLLRFDPPHVRSNGSAPDPTCDCADEDSWGRGDENPFLGLSLANP